MRKIIISFIISWLLISQHPVYSQTAALDSLSQLIRTTKVDSLNLHYRIAYALRYSKIDYAKADSQLQAIKKEAIDKKIPGMYADALLNEGTIHYDRGEYISSIVLAEAAEKAYNSLPEGKFRDWGLAATYNNRGTAYSLLNDLDNAQIFYQKVIDVSEKLKDSSNLLTSNFNMAFLYVDMQQWSKALEYLNKSIQYGPGAWQPELLLYACSRTAAINFIVGKNDEGLKLLHRADTLFKQNPGPLSSIYYYNAYGVYYLSQQQPDKALKMQEQAYGKSLEYKDPYYIVDEAWEMGRMYLQLQKTEEARNYLQIAIDTGKKYNFLPKIRFILKEWALYFDKKGDFKKASALKSELLSFTDSLVSMQDHNRILLFDARYQTEKKETRIRELESTQEIQAQNLRQQRIINYLLAGVAVTILVISLLAYRNYRQKQKLQEQRIQELEIEKQLLATEAVLKGESQERTRLAKDLHDGLGGMLSGIKFSLNTMKGNMVMTPENAQAFEKSLDMLDSSISEMRRVAHNMMPEALVKFGLDTALKDFCFDINQSGAIKVVYQSIGLENWKSNQTFAITIYRIIQEMLNNTLKHAKASTAIVQLTRIENQLSVTVEDDGIGFDPAELSRTKGIGWTNIQNRVEFIKGHLDLQSAPGKGTSFHMEFPLPE